MWVDHSVVWTVETMVVYLVGQKVVLWVVCWAEQLAA